MQFGRVVVEEATPRRREFLLPPRYGAELEALQQIIAWSRENSTRAPVGVFPANREWITRMLLEYDPATTVPARFGYATPKKQSTTPSNIKAKERKEEAARLHVP